MTISDLATWISVLLSFFALIVTAIGVIVSYLTWQVSPERSGEWWTHLKQSTARKLAKPAVIGLTVLFTVTAILVFMRFRYEDHNSSFLVAANGDLNGPWLDSGIRVHGGDVLEFEASGSVTTAIHHLVEAAQKDEESVTPWVGPRGVEVDSLHGVPRQVEDLRAHKRIATKINYLALIGRISDENPNNHSDDPLKLWLADDNSCFEVGASGKHDCTTSGKLWLTVNDVWLNKTMEDIYVPDENKYKDYYAKKLKPDGTPQDAVYRKALWANLVADNRWNAWYQDNAGAFLVNVNRRSRRFWF